MMEKTDVLDKLVEWMDGCLDTRQTRVSVSKHQTNEQVEVQANKQEKRMDEMDAQTDRNKRKE